VARKKNVLVVVAHADDLEFMAGGTVARFAAEKGYSVSQYILTDNSKGSFRLSGRELIELSAAEAIEAGRVLGLEKVWLEGYPDGELDRVPPHVLRGQIMAKIRELRADVVMSWDPFAPCEEHPDHRAVAMATLEAASFSGNPLFYPEHGLPPHPVTEAYWFAKEPFNAQTIVDISSTIDRKLEALLKHDCQMRLTVDAMVQEAQALDADLPMLAALGEGGYREVIGEAVRQWCAENGKPAGFDFAEVFRYQKLVGLDRYLGTQLVTPDFESPAE
jgi:LmbE family N-acetylglucosaminyl deacetylase